MPISIIVYLNIIQSAVWFSGSSICEYDIHTSLHITVVESGIFCPVSRCAALSCVEEHTRAQQEVLETSRSVVREEQHTGAVDNAQLCAWRPIRNGAESHFLKALRTSISRKDCTAVSPPATWIDCFVHLVPTTSRAPPIKRR